METKGIVLTEYTDKDNNVMAGTIEGQGLYLEYVTACGDYAFNFFAEGTDEFKVGLYRMAKIAGWMHSGAYSNAQRMEFLCTGTMA